MFFQVLILGIVIQSYVPALANSIAYHPSLIREEKEVGGGLVKQAW